VSSCRYFVSNTNLGENTLAVKLYSLKFYSLLLMIPADSRLYRVVKASGNGGENSLFSFVVLTGEALSKKAKAQANVK
ncbi:hypothetical protein ACRTDU_14520, partial [Sunxiuqinia elliptica]